MAENRRVKPYDRDLLDRLVMQHDLAAYWRQRGEQPTEADGQESVGESE